MKSVLFVDDEPFVLSGLERMLYHQRGDFKMTFCLGGAKAIEALRDGRFDVIVTDMRMPHIDGAQLLEKVKETHPGIVRIVLSGFAEMELALRTIPVAHQFLAKPCDPEILKVAIYRACALQELLNNDFLKSVVGKTHRLPSLPKVYQELVAALKDPVVTVERIAGIMSRDVAISAKVLQLVNSAFFGTPKRVSNILDAVSYLGLNMLKNIVLSVETFRSFETGSPELKGFLEDLQNHSLFCANVARTFLSDKQKADDAFMAGLLHDIGKLVLLVSLPDAYPELVRRSREEKVPLHEIERRTWGASHAEVGAYLLGLWGLPYPVIEAIANHHDPARVAGADFGEVAALHVANCLSQKDDSFDAFDRDYLRKIGVAERLDEWRATARDVSERLARGARDEIA